MTTIQLLALLDNDWDSVPVEHWDHTVEDCEQQQIAITTYDDLIAMQDEAIEAMFSPEVK